MNFRLVSQTATTLTFAWDPPAGQRIVWLTRPDGVTTRFISATKSSHTFKKKLAGEHRLEVFTSAGVDRAGVGFASSEVA